MKPLKILLFPGYVRLWDTLGASPGLTQALRERGFQTFPGGKGVEIEVIQWDGLRTSIPKDERVMVRASSKLDGYGMQELGALCEELGHLCFYYNELVTSAGNEEGDALNVAAIAFLDEVLGPAEA